MALTKAQATDVKVFILGLSHDDPKRIEVEDDIIRKAKATMTDDAAALFSFLEKAASRDYVVHLGLQTLTGEA